MGATEMIILTEGLKPSDKGFWDTIFDRFSRVFIPRAIFVAAIFVAGNWYKDKIKCIVPDSVKLNMKIEYIENMCWMKGFYIYEEIGNENEHNLFGIPTFLENDGKLNNTNVLCSTKVNGTRNHHCVPMKKTKFNQYQFMHFFLIGLWFAYSLPFMIITLWTWNQLCFERESEDRAISIEQLISRYFSENMDQWLFRKSDGKKKNMYSKVSQFLFGERDSERRYFDGKVQFWIHFTFEVLVRALVVVVNIASFLLTDHVLNGTFMKYGYEWERWGEVLPTSGICEVKFYQYVIMDFKNEF